MRAKYFNYRRPPRSADNSWRWFFAKLRWSFAKLNELTGMFTLILAMATIGLWLATRNLVVDAEDTAKRQLRAYLYIAAGDFLLASNPDGSSTLTIKPVLKIFGFTPITSIVPIWYVTLQQVPTSISMPYPTLISELALSATRDIANVVENPPQDMSLAVKNITLQKDDIEALKQKHKALVIFGSVSYEDVFGSARWTNFCWISDWNDIITNNFNLCPIYNNTDWGRSLKNNTMTLTIAPATIK